MVAAESTLNGSTYQASAIQFSNSADIVTIPRCDDHCDSYFT